MPFTTGVEESRRTPASASRSRSYWPLITTEAEVKGLAILDEALTIGDSNVDG